MTTHEIEPMKYSVNRSDDYVTGWNDCYAAIEADRIKRDDYINDDRDQLRAEIVALKGTIADLEADRQRRDEPAGEIQCRIYHDTEQHRDYLKARFHPDTWKNRVSFEWQGHRWAYRYTHFDDSGEYDLIARTAPQPSEPVACFKCGHAKHGGECVNVAPQPAEPVKRKRRYAQGTALGELGIIPMCDQVDDEPVKVPSFVELTNLAIEYGVMAGPILQGSRHAQLNESERFDAFIHTLLARYGSVQPAISGQAETRMNAGFAARNGGDLGQPAQSGEPKWAYDKIDRFLRNNLGDDDYAEYSAALDALADDYDATHVAQDPDMLEVLRMCVGPLNLALAMAQMHPGADSARETMQQCADAIDRVQAIFAAPVAAQVQAVVNQQMTTAASDALADTQRQIIEAAERRGYERGLAECAQGREDSERYRWLRDPCSGAEHIIFYSRGDYGKGLMSGEMLDAAIDAARAAK